MVCGLYNFIMFYQRWSFFNVIFPGATLLSFVFSHMYLPRNAPNPSGETSLPDFTSHGGIMMRSEIFLEMYLSIEQILGLGIHVVNTPQWMGSPAYGQPAWDFMTGHIFDGQWWSSLLVCHWLLSFTRIKFSHNPLIRLWKVVGRFTSSLPIYPSCSNTFGR